MLAIEPIRPGNVIHWHVEDILRHESIDMPCYVGYFYHDDKMLEPDDEEFFLALLDRKRQHYHYGGVVESLRSEGFLRPVTAFYDVYTGHLVFGDGHHRLAASIDLGFTIIPVLIVDCEDNTLSKDSGIWSLGDPVPEFDGYIL